MDGAQRLLLALRISRYSMAIFSASPAVGSISGNAGGLCFVNSRGSKVVRKTRARQASIQDGGIKAQADFATATRIWRGLTEDQRNAWRTYAIGTPSTNRLGEQSPLSGYQAFLKNALFNGIVLPAVNEDPPLISEQPIIAPITVSWSLASELIYVTGTGPIAGSVNIQIGAMPLYTDSIPKFWGRYKVIGTVTMAQNNNLAVTVLWDAVFSTPNVGQVVAFRTRFFSFNGTWRSEQNQIFKVTA